jgi:two-component system, chemotaxis family, CheB/CheR fusion protein
MAARTNQSFELLLEHLKRSRGFDFTGYKRASLERRVRKRMDVVGVQDYGDYVDHLEVHPDEFAFLFNTILINVTAFYRDPETWEFLRDEIVPEVVQARSPSDPIRVWCAGCASGEETYTAAMLLAEAMGESAFAERVKIYATDVDGEALDHARTGVYSAKDLEPVPAELRDRYFDRIDQRFAFRKDLRRSVIFGRNDLVQDAPISRVDLLLCRNTLMYFTAETQERILRRFHFALDPAGYLFLGKSEMLITHTDLFTPVSLKRRVFTKVPKTTMRERLAFAMGEDGTPHEAGEELRESAFDTAASGQIVVDREGVVVEINSVARSLFGLGRPEVGRPLRELETGLGPAEIGDRLERALAERRSATLPVAECRTPRGDVVDLEVIITPLVRGDEALGAGIAFVDRSAERHVKEELERAQRELSGAYDELQSTVEELETTNEELQSTNEELETTNEELQSTNEELETMNEELQSTNEELETMNDELRQRSLELNEVNAFMETILTGMGVGVVVVDRAQHVQIWNRHSELLWGMRAEEAENQHVLSLDIGMPVERLKAPLRGVIAGDLQREEVVLSATDRRGRAFECRLTVLPLSTGDGGPSGAIVLAERAAGDGAASAGE